ncbi:tyrosine-type recombinase/integrase [Neobacillus sp. NPDC058068]|uniref:tyrosine-type recombinase/integrase n=1 Tax=Neobacillus sp. NPDC058068 TaxID=3346325 RepID=UPI0036D92AFC
MMGIGKNAGIFSNYAAAQTGMRKSELIGLTWENVDIKDEKFYIRQMENNSLIKSQKTKNQVEKD